ncbi:MAG: hypothetical protein K2X86_07835 [Cytophagaceae bacterium]|nr:hypothetical protein [Cytophagaceae bacterium]
MKNLIFLITAGFLFASCERNTSTEKASSTDSTAAGKMQVDINPMPVDTMGMMVKGDIRLLPLKGSPEFSDAVLELNAPSENSKQKSGEPVSFKYEVKNYKLRGSKTPNPSCNQCNESKDGQHIHLIFNNEPYIAVYKPDTTLNLKDGHYVALSFLSRSYHESLKHFEAADIRQFTVGNAKAKSVDLSKPMLFYSRPKGEYKGQFAKRILLDFYLVNNQLSADGNKVRATINGNEFLINKWQPYVIEGLPMGENIIKLELIDKDGKLVDGPFNSIERKITLIEEPAS